MSATAGTAALTAEQRARLAERLRGVRQPAAQGIPRAPEGPVPISAEQEQLVRHALFAPGNPIYNECITLVHTGTLDVDALRTALHQLVARHDVWHSAFRRQSRRFVQVVLPVPRFDLPVHDLRGAPAEELERLVSSVAIAPYDMKEGPLLRPLLVRVSDDEHRLYLALHHIVFDGVSLYRIVLPELTALYDAAAAGRPAALPPAVQYRDYAAWQASALDAELARSLPWWRDHLDGAPTLALPLDRPRPVERTFRGSTHWFVVDADLTAAVRDWAGHRGATLFHVLAAAYALMLRDLSGQDEVVFATVADRRVRRELEGMVGYCLTPAPLRLQVTDDPAAMVEGVRQEMLDVLAHNVPFERVVADLDPAHPVGANPVFQAMIVLEPPAIGLHHEWSMHQLDATVGALLGHAKNDVHLELDERVEGHLSARLIVNREIIGDATAERCVASYLQHLRALVS